MSDQSFNIQFVANITGINPHTIRAWEKRYKAINPKRDHNGRRMYDQNDIDRLNLLFGLVKVGNSISDIASLSSTELENIHNKFIGQIDSNNLKHIILNVQESLSNLNMALEFFKLDIISHELDKACTFLNPKDLALEIIAPLVIKIRIMKQEDKLSEKQRSEIFLVIKSHIVKKLFRVKTDTKESKKIILASPKGELNEMGILIAALLCQYHNVDFYYLGTHVPADQLAEIAHQLRSDIIFLGLNYSVQSIMYQEVIDYQEVLIENMSKLPEIWVGTFDSCTIIDGFKCVDSFNTLERKIEKL